MTRLQIARAAQDDLRNIRAYSKSAFGPPVARAYLDGIRERFALLRIHALVGADEADLGKGLRSLRYRSHRIYYAVQEEAILIVRILHHAQDAPRVPGRE